MSWKATVDIKKHLTEDEAPPAIRESCHKIASQLGKAMPGLALRGIDVDILDEIVLELSEAEDVDEANDILDWLYDWADEERVWLGLRMAQVVE